MPQTPPLSSSSAAPARRRIAVVTGSRADYGLLRWPMQAIAARPELDLSVIVTGMHLAPDFGLTVREIEGDGFTIAERVETLLASDTPVGVTKSIGLGLIGFADALARLRPDMVLLLGDRYEILAAAQAALIARIPVAHLYGGDLTEGAFDDAIRHAITKMAHLHFVASADAAARVRQLGEDPARIYQVGVPSLDAVLQLPPVPRAQLEADLNHPLPPQFLLTTFHPETLAEQSPESQLDALLSALDQLRAEGVGVIFTLPNADTEGRTLLTRIKDWAASRPDVGAFTSLGQRRYIGLMRHAAAVVGNSSSGIYEAPALGVPTVDIGNRQGGRLRAASVTTCPAEPAAIVAAIRAALAAGHGAPVSLYGDGHSSARIAAILAALDAPAELVRKRFFDLPQSGT